MFMIQWNEYIWFHNLRRCQNLQSRIFAITRDVRKQCFRWWQGNWTKFFFFFFLRSSILGCKPREVGKALAKFTSILKMKCSWFATSSPIFFHWLFSKWSCMHELTLPFHFMRGGGTIWIRGHWPIARPQLKT